MAFLISHVEFQVSRYRWLQPPLATVWLAKPAYPATQSSQGTYSYILTITIVDIIALLDVVISNGIQRDNPYAEDPEREHKLTVYALYIRGYNTYYKV